MRIILFISLLSSLCLGQTQSSLTVDSTVVKKYIIPQRDHYLLIEGDKNIKIYHGRIKKELRLRPDLQPFIDLQQEYHQKSIGYGFLTGFAYAGAFGSYYTPRMLNANTKLRTIGLIGAVGFGALSFHLSRKGSKLSKKRDDLARKIITLYNYQP